MNTANNKVTMLEQGRYVVPCGNCGKALLAPELKYWRVLSTNTYVYFCGAECSTAGHQRGYTGMQGEVVSLSDSDSESECRKVA